MGAKGSIVKTKCAECGKERNNQARQYSPFCQTCSRKLKRHYFTHEQICTVYGCDKKYDSQGFCSTHRRSWHLGELETRTIRQDRLKNERILLQNVLNKKALSEDSRHYKILSLRSSGLSLGEISKKVKLSKATVQYVVQKWVRKNNEPKI